MESILDTCNFISKSQSFDEMFKTLNISGLSLNDDLTHFVIDLYKSSERFIIKSAQTQHADIDTPDTDMILTETNSTSNSDPNIGGSKS